ncbi:tRNA sulfurtransferase [Stygiolobus caldivivus]|uniref:Probable tRNA sulfurtransferase n=1 Tax=Stygiolobus caldivivus TaxID=2824673 RepID=A0A8D5U4Y0_9CREN|nr:tRNA sulfurtransferase [Stygiolobus caldivivus]BCU69342.1 tRNA 4-thiouridine(8) synthase ThiI [Stygiolobus caldivivus]
MGIIIVRPSGELAIKSSYVRRIFIRKLVKNISTQITVSKWRVDQGYIILETEGDVSRLSYVFGISYFYVAEEINFSTIQELAHAAVEKFAELVRGKKFAVRVRRTGEHEFTSMDIAREVGKLLLPFSAGVDLENPEAIVHIDVIQNRAYLYSEEHQGPNGFPVGTTGKTVVLFSGGLDSPVATWMMMKRGAKPILLNVKLGGELQKNLVIDEIKVLSKWSGGEKLKVYFVDGLKISTYLSNVNKFLRVITLKRIMYKLADFLGRKTGAYSITTGESLSQVSSQTMKNLFVSEYGINRPVFRPLIGMDKEEIVSISRKIGTYELSSKMPEYCIISSKSTVRARLSEVLDNEKDINIDYKDLLDHAEVLEV